MSPNKTSFCDKPVISSPTMKLFNKNYTSNVSLCGKTAIITGSSSGIGKAIAQDFYGRGARIIMACRNIRKAQEVSKEIKSKHTDKKNLGEIIIVELDLSNFNSVRRCAKQLNKKENNIDILINNAAVLCPSFLTEDGYEIHFATNHLGHFLFTLLLLPKITKSTHARIINVSSIGHMMTHLDVDNIEDEWKKKAENSITIYHQSKLVNILFTRELANRLSEANIKNVSVYSLHPGFTNTALLKQLDELVFRGSKWLFQTFLYFFINTPEQGAQTIIYCAVDEKVAYESGVYYWNCELSEPSSDAKSDEKAKKVWDLSLKFVGLEHYDAFTILK